MKRFTARFRIEQIPLDPEQIRRAVVEALLRAPMPAAFHIGTIDVRENEVWVEVASDAPRETLRETLAAVETRLPVKLESLGWGWLASEAAIIASDACPSWRQDPFRKGVPQREPDTIYPYSRTNTVKMILSCLTYASPLVVLGLVFSNFPLAVFYKEHELTIQFVWIGFITFVAFLGVFRFPTRWPRWVRIDPQGMAVKYWLPPRVQEAAWEDVETLEMGNGQVVLRGKGRSMRFFTEGLAGKDTLNTLVRTISERAGLNFVESGVEKAVYRRFEAR